MALARPIVFGNWKMYGLRADGIARATRVRERHTGAKGTLGIFPPATILSAIADVARGSALLVGGQDCHYLAEGAFTGSVSAPMMSDAGAVAVILGHSERRHGAGDTDEIVRKKVEAALRADLLAVVCVGETEAERAAGRHEEVLSRQVAEGLPGSVPAARLVVAYEPVWAVGSGRTPEPEEIRSAHAFVRARLRDLWQKEDVVPIIYGGSVKPANAAAILSIEGVDGALVGGASLEADDLLSIFHSGGGS